ncbi:hypothetical protein C3E77_06710 [Mycetocola zhujimingii]|nr:hypothetical protein C3E77_06710 [Mycetocola zhujimingii]
MTVSYFFHTESVGVGSSQLRTVRTIIIVLGVVAIVTGIAIFVWPEATLSIVAWLFGLYFVVSGLTRIGRAIAASGQPASYRVFLAVLGILLVIGGVFVFANPMFGVAVVAAVIGLTWIVEGIGVLMDVPRGGAAWLAVLVGVVCILGGLVLLFAPVAATVFWLQVSAALLVVVGVMQIAQGATLGRAPRR